MSQISTISGLQLARFGLGSWALGGSYGTNRCRYDVIQAIRAGIECGFNAIDTAQGYGAGASELMLARLLCDHRRQDLFIISKFGIHYPDSAKPLRRDSASARARNSLDQSLWNLNTDYIDAYLVHWPDWVTPADDVAEGLDLARQSGKARHIGVCNYTLEQLETLSAYIKLDFIQYPYSIVDRRIDTLGIVAWARREDVKIITYGSLAFGALISGASSNWEIGDWRKDRPDHFGTSLFRPDKLQRIRNCGLTVPVIKAWLQQQTSSDLPLIGFQLRSEVEEFVNAGPIDLDRQQIDNLLVENGVDPSPPTWLDEFTKYALTSSH